MMTMAIDLDSAQIRAIEASLDAGLAIAGAAGTGKTTALAARARRARELDASVDPLFFDERNDVATLAFAILHDLGIAAREIDDVEAELRFATCAQPLFDLAWEEFVDSALDPEVPGLRSPQRFLESAFRLMRRLRDGLIEPDRFLELSLAGATEFYANPPNFAHPELLYATKDVYRDSLDVDAHELERQYRREVDLAKILAKLYALYVASGDASGSMTKRDAVATAVARLRERPEVAEAVRARRRYAFVDDADSLTAGEVRLLQLIFGERLSGVTLAGDFAGSHALFSGGRPDLALAAIEARVALETQYRLPVAVERIDLYRARDERDEARCIADHVASLLASGASPASIGILVRSAATIEPLEQALLDRDVAAAAIGDANIFTDRRALDALALLWNVEDPFRHDWMLRTLGNPALGLSDATLVTLCSEPPSPQTPLFVLDDDPAPTVRPSRWDPKRDLRLGWNVVRGEQDAALWSEARARLQRFRALREGWLAALQTLPIERFIIQVWNEGLAREGPAGSARALAQQLVLRRLLERLERFARGREHATLADLLGYAEQRAGSDLESCEDDPGEGIVGIYSIEAARGRSFDHIVVAGVGAGIFPRWYVPDTFIFSPRLGMIPRENAGEARASRTAKFSYYMHSTKAREKYNDNERRAFVYALRRARQTVLVTTPQKATRGITAPEFFEELRVASNKDGSRP